MTPLKMLAAAACASAALTGGAYAADAITYPTTASPEPVPVYENAGFDWNRFYAGISAHAQDYDGDTTDWEYGLGVQAGVNAQFDFYLLGGEVSLSGLTNGDTDRTYGQVLARGGLVVTDETVIYAAGGYGVDLSAATEEHWLAGGGVEFAVTDDVSLRAQYLHGFGTTDGAADMNQVSFGVNYHF